MAKKRFYMAVLILVALSLSSCGTIDTYYPDSPVNRNWGRSVEAMMHRQMVAPEQHMAPERPPPPVTGLDPQAAEAIIQKYRKSFEKRIELPNNGGMSL